MGTTARMPGASRSRGKYPQFLPDRRDVVHGEFVPEVVALVNCRRWRLEERTLCSEAELLLPCSDPPEGRRHRLRKRCARLMTQGGKQLSVIEPHGLTP